jgi:hypothetical protein
MIMWYTVLNALATCFRVGFALAISYSVVEVILGN